MDSSGSRIHGGADGRQEPFAQVARSVLQSRGLLEPMEKLAYCVLKSYDWHDEGCWPSRETLAADMGVSTDTVDRAIGGLVKAGLVEKRRRGQGLTNTYLLRVPDSAPTRTLDSAPTRHEGEALKEKQTGRSIDLPPDTARAAPGGRVTTPFQSLVTTCGIGEHDGRARRQAAIALHGIRDLHRDELDRAGLPPEPDEALVDAIRRKADIYRTRLPDVLLTPMALLYWWLDVELQPAARRSDGFSPEEIKSFCTSAVTA